MLDGEKNFRIFVTDKTLLFLFVRTSKHDWQAKLLTQIKRFGYVFSTCILAQWWNGSHAGLT